MRLEQTAPPWIAKPCSPSALRRAYWEGDAAAEIVVIRDDGREDRLPARYFFRTRAEFSPVDSRAVELCRGHVLDVGAGSGVHSLVLQEKGLAVTAIDISRDAVAVMMRRGVIGARCAHIMTFRGGPFDTILMLGHGIGVVETIAGLDRFLAAAGGLITPGGQILLDSTDISVAKDPGHLAYQEANRKTGRCAGEIRLRLAHRDTTGPSWWWLQVDSETLAKHARIAGWKSEVILRQGKGDFPARLTRIA